MKKLVSLLVFSWLALTITPCFCQSDDMIWNNLSNKMSEQLANKNYHYEVHCIEAYWIDEYEINYSKSGKCNYVFWIFPEKFIMMETESTDPLNKDKFEGFLVGTANFFDFGSFDLDGTTFVSGIYGEKKDKIMICNPFEKDQNNIFLWTGDNKFANGIKYKVKSWTLKFDN